MKNPHMWDGDGVKIWQIQRMHNLDLPTRKSPCDALANQASCNPPAMRAMSGTVGESCLTCM